MSEQERVTGDELRAQAEAHGITRWIIHRCGFCGYPCGFVFYPTGDVSYDSGCDCVTYPSWPDPRDWADVAAHFNLQRDPGVIGEYRAFWHLDGEASGE